MSDATALAYPTRTLAHWVAQSSWAQVKPDIQHATSRSWLNWLGCALGGANDPAVTRLIGALQALQIQGPAPLIGRSEQVDLPHAALLHAFASNILDYDDTHWATAIHPAGPVASALVAWSSQSAVTGQEMLHAFLLGMEVACRIGLAVSPGHYEKGWHITGTCGVFGAAVAVGRLMRLTPQQMAWALGHAATQSAGLVASLGTEAKSLNIAQAARNGLVAAQWARHGITANEAALEAPFGFAQVMGPGRMDDTLCQGLGDHWEAARNTFKPYPCGFLLHPLLQACLDTPDPLRLDAEAINQIDRLIVSVHPLTHVRTNRPQPADALEAKLSAQHAVAMALLRGEAGVAQFAEKAVQDPTARDLRAKIVVVDDASLPTDGARLEVRWHSGRVDLRAAPAHHGQAQTLSDAALARKFRELVAYGAPHCDADTLLAALARYAHAERASDLIALTRPHIPA